MFEDEMLPYDQNERSNIVNELLNFIDNAYNTLIYIPIKYIISFPEQFMQTYNEYMDQLDNLIDIAMQYNITYDYSYYNKITIMQNLLALIKFKIMYEYKDLPENEQKNISKYVYATLKKFAQSNA